MAAGDDDLVMVVFLVLTLVEDPTVLARPLPSFDSLVSDFPAHILIPLDIIFILIYPYSPNNYHILIDEKLLRLCNYVSPPNDVTSSIYLQVLPLSVIKPLLAWHLGKILLTSCA